MKKSTTHHPLAEYVVVISLDAVSKEDFEKVSTLPNLAKLKTAGSYSSHVATVLPAQTYTVHTSIVTGMHPRRHGIVNNHPLQPGVPAKNQSWYSYRHEIKAPVIYEAAQAKGLKTASFLWPVTEKSTISYNLPEIAAIPGENQIIRTLLGGSTGYLLTSLLKFRKQIATSQPGVDRFNTAYAAHTILKKKPHLTLIHLTNVDYVKHTTGLDAKAAEEALHTIDEQVGQIIEATQSAGIFDKTAFLILSDHGQLKVEKNVRLNNAFVRAGLITLDETGTITDWQAYAQTTGNGALITIKPKASYILEQVKQVLTELKADSRYGIQSILDEKQVTELGGGDYAFVIQGTDGIHFSDSISNPADWDDFYDQDTPYATHGYTPLAEDTYGINCIFIASGAGIKQGIELSHASVLDYAPTIARLLGLDNFDVKECDGKVLTEILEHTD